MITSLRIIQQIQFLHHLTFSCRLKKLLVPGAKSNFVERMNSTNSYTPWGS